MLTDGPLVFVGAPGAGTTSVGQRVAERLGRPFADVNHLVEQAAGMPAGELYVVEGEDRARALEREQTLVALALPDAVIAAASGSILDAEVRDALSRRTVVWLQVDATRSSRRSGLSAIAPGLFAGMRTRLIRQLAERDPLYAAVATLSVDTNARTVDEVAAAVLEGLDGLGEVGA